MDASTTVWRSIIQSSPFQGPVLALTSVQKLPTLNHSVVDSLKTQILEKLPDVGSDGSHTIGHTQSAVDFNEKSIGEDAN